MPIASYRVAGLPCARRSVPG